MISVEGGVFAIMQKRSQKCNSYVFGGAVYLCSLNLFSRSKKRLSSPLHVTTYNIGAIFLFLGIPLLNFQNCIKFHLFVKETWLAVGLLCWLKCFFWVSQFESLMLSSVNYFGLEKMTFRCYQIIHNLWTCACA